MADHKNIENLMNLRGKPLYVHQDMTFKEIAEMLGVDARTVSRHAKKGEWEKAKELAGITPEKIKRMVVEQMIAIKDGEEVNSKTIDALSKLHAIYKGFSDTKQNHLAWLDGFKECAMHFIKLNRVEDAQLLNQLHDQFVQDVIF